jgi:glucose-1-phosphate cytidylyltransferase
MLEEEVALKVAIIAGGMGTRMQEETKTKPKALVTLGDRPIMWHMMKYFGHYGLSDFVIALGYKGDSIKDYFCQSSHPSENIRPSGQSGGSDVVTADSSAWTTQMVDTGADTQNGGRLKRLADHLQDGTFFMTYCDSLMDAVPQNMIDFHKSHGRLATVIVVNPRSRFGFAELEGDQVLRFSEKPVLTDRWISTGYFILEPGIFEYIDGDDAEWSYDCLPRLASDGQLMAYRHKSFWRCMDTAKERDALEQLWADTTPPWKVWE